MGFPFFFDFLQKAPVGRRNDREDREAESNYLVVLIF